MHRRYSLRAVAETLGVHPRTIRRHVTAGHVPDAEKTDTAHGPAWTIGPEGLEALRCRFAHDVEIKPAVVETPASEQPAPLARAGMLAELAALLEGQREGAERAAAAEREAWRVAVDRLEDTAAHLRGLLEDERAAHAETRARLEDVLRHHGRPTQPVSLAAVRERLTVRAEG